MKTLLLFLLFSQLFGDIYHLKKYDDTPNIQSGSGLVVLDVLDFNEGDSIYVTYHTYQGKSSYSSYPDSTYYLFSNDFPTSDNQSILTNVLKCYSDGSSSTQHNESTGYDTYHIYYTYDFYYFYEFIKPNNSKYLIMGYDLTYTNARDLEVSNTRFRRYIMTLIIVGSIVGFLLVVGAIILIYIKRDSLNCECCLDCISIICCPFTFCCKKKVYSSEIAEGTYEHKEEVSMKYPDSYPGSADFANMENEKSKEADAQDLLVDTNNDNNNNYNEVVPEKPYYEQNSNSEPNQISTYIPPQFQVYQKPNDGENQNQNSVTPPPQINYEVNNINENNKEQIEQNNLNVNNNEQNDINSNNNQYPQNPPLDNNQNDIGYSSGGNGIYQ